MKTTFAILFLLCSTLYGDQVVSNTIVITYDVLTKQITIQQAPVPTYPPFQLTVTR